MLPAGEHVKAVYLGDDGVIANAARGALLIDSSTIDVATTRDVSKAAAERGFDMLDAPVSGGVAGASAGTLTFMVGGLPRRLRAADP
ncbi:MAG: NAD(P)-binding domain-containing protein [Parvularculaceae bacterium]